jgi:hypothetical protein
MAQVECEIRIMEPGTSLVAHWRHLGLSIAQGNPEEKLSEFESRFRISLPLDFRGYLSTVDGMAQLGGQDCDKNGFSFWPLRRIEPMARVCADNSLEVPEVRSPERYFVLADYLQWCWGYAICLGESAIESGTVIHVGTIRPKNVATSFTEFVDLYLRNARELFTR